MSASAEFGIQLPAANKMKVKMRHQLSPFRAAIYNQAIASAGYTLFLCQILGYDDNASGEYLLLIGKFSRRYDMVLRYNEHVCGCSGQDIPESQKIFILIHYVGG
jgi:hypothetical protein